MACSRSAHLRSTSSWPSSLCVSAWSPGFFSLRVCVSKCPSSHGTPVLVLAPHTHTHSMTSSSKTQLPTRPLFTCASGQNCDIFLGSAIRATMAPERVFRLSVPAVSTARLLEAGPRSILEDRRRISAARLKPEAEVSVTVHLGLPDQRGTPPSVCSGAVGGGRPARCGVNTTCDVMWGARVAALGHAAGVVAG